MREKRFDNQRGIVLILALLLLLVCTLIGINAINTANFETVISGNKRASEQAFYIAEAGINEFMGRFRQGAAGAMDYYASTDKNNGRWRFYIALDTKKAGTKDCNPNDTTNQRFYASLQDSLDYVVEIKHKTDPSTGQVIKFAGEPVYIVDSSGFTSDGGKKEIEAELVKRPNYDPPAALYSEAPVDILAPSTTIQGNDQCGTMNKPAIIKTDITPDAPTDPVNISGSPEINGSEPIKYVLKNGPKDLGLYDMINYLKSNPDYEYSYNGSQTLTGTGTGDYPWGTPTTNGKGEPLTYTGHMNIIHIRLTGTSGHNTLTFTGDSQGAGILFVEGDLNLHGNFHWYGVILVTGGVTLTGGSSDTKNITGGLLAGEAGIKIEGAGATEMFYCSKVADKINDHVILFKMLRWGENF